MYRSVEFPPEEKGKPFAQTRPWTCRRWAPSTLRMGALNITELVKSKSYKLVINLGKWLSMAGRGKWPCLTRNDSLVSPWKRAAQKRACSRLTEPRATTEWLQKTHRRVRSRKRSKSPASEVFLKHHHSRTLAGLSWRGTVYESLEQIPNVC